ncbi:MAG: acyl-CoA thioesterase [Verrucomicrobia bacterium]|nr:acyl-CoA thioesterase [Verrucomicrobiota bacterium]
MRTRDPVLTVAKPVEFFDTDMAGIVHFSCFFRYMEFAEARLFESLGFPLIQQSSGSFSGFPRVKAECQYSAPLYFGETVQIEIYVDAVGTSSITYSFRFRVTKGEGTGLIAKGTMTTVFASVKNPGDPLRSVAIPDALRAQLSACVASAGSTQSSAQAQQ